MPVVTDISQALLGTLAVFLAALPSILGAIVLIIVGWIVAGFLAALVVRVLRAIRIDQLADRSGVTGFLKKANVRADAAGVVAGLVKWYIRLVFLLLAANAVGLTAVSGIVTSVLAFIPNLIVAMFILGVFSWLASTAKNLVSGGMESAGPGARRGPHGPLAEAARLPARSRTPRAADRRRCVSPWAGDGVTRRRSWPR